jgi:hypothetical protein
MNKIINYLNNKWILILIAITSVFLLVITNRLYQKPNKHSEWRYEIHGYVVHKGKPHPAIWFTDTIELGNNYASYHNSDGTQVVIPSPYVIIDYKYNKVIKDSVPTFP